jgi:hypothetical protein
LSDLRGGWIAAAGQNKNPETNAKRVIGDFNLGEIMISDTSGKRFGVILRVAESQPLGTPRNPTIERFASKN